MTTTIRCVCLGAVISENMPGFPNENPGAKWIDWKFYPLPDNSAENGVIPPAEVGAFKFRTWVHDGVETTSFEYNKVYDFTFAEGSVSARENLEGEDEGLIPHPDQNIDPPGAEES